MADSHSQPEVKDTERHELLTHFKKLGLVTDDELSEIRSASHEDFQKSIDELQNTKKEYQDYFRQLITIKDVIEKYLSRLISDMLDGRDVTEPLQHATEMYPSLRFITWLIEEVERDLTEFIKDLDIDSAYVLPILYRWKNEYKPLGDIWWELERRRYGRENHWTGIRRVIHYNHYRQIPQVSLHLLSRKKIVWNAREDLDDIAELSRVLLVICMEALSESPERIDPVLLERMRNIIRETEETMEKLKALPILRNQPQNVSEDSTNTK